VRLRQRATPLRHSLLHGRNFPVFSLFRNPIAGKSAHVIIKKKIFRRKQQQQQQQQQEIGNTNETLRSDRSSRHVGVH